LVLLLGGCGTGDGGDSDEQQGADTTIEAISDLADDDVITVVPIGDSITAGPYYRPHLVRGVPADCPIDFIGTFEGAGTPVPDDAAELDLDHQAVGGATSVAIVDQLDGWLAELPPPDIALVYLGTNDFYASIDRATTIESLESVVDALRRANPAVAVVLAQIMPSIDVESGVEALNARIATLAARLDSTGSPVVVVDMAEGVDVERDLVDGVHPDDTQSRNMAERWAEVLDGLLGERCRL
jgi:mannan endo-1,4-beta-mannosidase